MTKTDYAVAPGEYLAEWRYDHEQTRDFTAKALNIQVAELDEFVSGRVELDAIFAARLEGLTGIPTAAWLRYEQQYRADLVRLRDEAARAE